MLVVAFGFGYTIHFGMEDQVFFTIRGGSDLGAVIKMFVVPIIESRFTETGPPNAMKDILINNHHDDHREKDPHRCE